ncbi:unnamed protein product [Knipowitschia caucasica]
MATPQRSQMSAQKSSKRRSFTRKALKRKPYTVTRQGRSDASYTITYTAGSPSSKPGQSNESCGDQSMIIRDDFKPQAFSPTPHTTAATIHSELSADKDYKLRTPHDPIEEQRDFAQNIQAELECELKSQWLQDAVSSKVKSELRNYNKALSSGSCQIQMNEGQLLHDSIRNLTTHVLREKSERLADYFKKVFSDSTGEFSKRLKARLKQKYTCLFEGIPQAGKPSNLDEIYTELYVTEGDTSDYNNRHDITHIEAAPRHKVEETITCQDIFTGQSDSGRPMRTVMTKGVAGIGKTILTQRFSLDWAEGRANQDIQLLLPFTFRELNVIRDKNMSLVQLIQHFFPETGEALINNVEDFKVAIILDGLDEFRAPLDFKTNVLIDEKQPAGVSILLVNLIRGNLLPSAWLWITTRPAAANQVPAECISRVTVVRGFRDSEKVQYFLKRFPKKRQARAIIDHIRLSRSLHIMCSIPVFCWITATVLENIMKTKHDVLLPKTLTEMYIHFLVVQVKIKHKKYDISETDSHWSQKSTRMIKCLAKLAFEQLQEGNIIFYESDLSENGLDVDEAAVDSGVFTKICKDTVLCNDQVFCFVHLSVQEFLAALHVHITFNETEVSVLSKMAGLSETHFYYSAVDLALKSPNGHLDLFIRFFLGLSLTTNQNLLRGFLIQKQDMGVHNKIITYIKQKVSESGTTERSINLFHCLNELKDSSLVTQIQQLMSSGSLCAQNLSQDQWSALAFILLSSNQVLEEFDLRRYSASEEVLLRLLPVVRVSTKAIVNASPMTERSCTSLSSVLFCPSSCLQELDLSNNVLTDPMVELLFQGLNTSPCTLEILCLRNCSLSTRSCEVLAPVLTSPSLSLVELDLTNNDLMDSGVGLLSEELRKPQCHLEKLILSGCMLTEKSSSILATVMDFNPQHLKFLDLSFNNLSETGEKLLTMRIEDPANRLEKLIMEPGGEIYLKPGLKKYSCQLLLDPTTVNKMLKISDNQKSVIREGDEQSYPDTSGRFESCPQVLCSQPLTGRCYWELQWKGWVDMSVCYEGIRRRGASDDCVFGLNSKSWSLSCSDGPYSISHNKSGNPLPISAVSSAGKVAVYLDCLEGCVTFYKVSGEELVLLHTFNTMFNEPLFMGIGLWSPLSSSTLCD